jgi:hypothetical protein
VLPVLVHPRDQISSPNEHHRQRRRSQRVRLRTPSWRAEPLVAIAGQGHGTGYDDERSLVQVLVRGRVVRPDASVKRRIASWENGHSVPDGDFDAPLLCEAFGIDATELGLTHPDAHVCGLHQAHPPLRPHPGPTRDPSRSDRSPHAPSSGTESTVPGDRYTAAPHAPSGRPRAVVPVTSRPASLTQT